MVNEAKRRQVMKVAGNSYPFDLNHRATSRLYRSFSWAGSPLDCSAIPHEGSELKP